MLNETKIFKRPTKQIKRGEVLRLSSYQDIARSVSDGVGSAAYRTQRQTILCLAELDLPICGHERRSATKKQMNGYMTAGRKNDEVCTLGDVRLLQAFRSACRAEIHEYILRSFSKADNSI